MSMAKTRNGLWQGLGCLQPGAQQFKLQRVYVAPAGCESSASVNPAVLSRSPGSALSLAPRCSCRW